MGNKHTHRFTSPFQLESGIELDGPTVVYNTYGELNIEKDNVIVVCHALTANSAVDTWWDGLFGSGNVFDPSKNFIICANNMGSPYGTISPTSLTTDGEMYGADFPFYTIRDKAKLYVNLLSDLGIDQNIKLLMGGSCGGNIAQEMAISLGAKVKNLALLCCSAKETPWTIGIHEAQRIAIECDPTFKTKENNAGSVGVKIARGMAMPYYRSSGSINRRQAETNNDTMTDFKAASYIRYMGVKFSERYNAHCYYHQLNSLDTHNVGRGRKSIKEALGLITAKTLCLAFSTDLLIPPKEQALLAEHIPNATFREIETDLGHDAFLIETDAIQSVIKEVLPL